MRESRTPTRDAITRVKKIKVLKSASSKKVYPPIALGRQTFSPPGETRKGISASDEAISPGFDFSRVAIPLGRFIGSVSIPASGSNADVRLSGWLARQAGRREAVAGTLCRRRRRRRPTSTPPASPPPPRRRRRRSQERSSPSRNV